MGMRELTEDLRLLDTLEDGRRVRLLAVVDDFTRACLATEVDTHAADGYCHALGWRTCH
jgi:hypothetical protein